MRLTFFLMPLLLVFSAIGGMAQPSNDNRVDAIDVTHTGPWTGGDAAYTNVEATPDGAAGSCAAVNKNVWFKFQAGTNEIEVKVQSGNAQGTLRYPNLTLYDSAGNALQCNYTNSAFAFLQNTGLTAGLWYYFSVSNLNPSSAVKAGTFTLIMTDDIGFDLREKALLISDSTWSSESAGLSNVTATPDGAAGSCAGVNKNVWFKFHAMNSDVEIKVVSGGGAGTMTYPNLTLYDSAGTPLLCNNEASTSTHLQTTSLTPGSWYYFSVSNNNTSSAVKPGTFTVMFTNDIGFDLREKALLTNGNGWSSGNAAFSNSAATPDGVAGSCAAANKNVWFKFQAKGSETEIRVLSGGGLGTLRYPNLTLYDSAGSPIQCDNTGSTFAFVQSITLTTGSWYYFSVSNLNPSSAVKPGTFTVTLTDSVGYDMQARARLVNANGWSSGNAAFSNVGATPDGTPTSCIAPTRNVWFKFLALTNEIEIILQTGAAKGTLTNSNLNLFDAQGNPIQCMYQGASTMLTISDTSLTVGSWYYISVDQYYNGNPGTFTLSVSNNSGPPVPRTFYSVANGPWHVPATWSLSEGGSPGTSYPNDLDTVYVRGFVVLVSESLACSELSIESSNENTGVRVEGNPGELRVINNVKITALNGASGEGLVVRNNGKLIVGSN